ncbi:MAG: segregation and condensation protein A, partial [Nitrospinae bacterium]|nr:segregation and condensation protein A [Nitrospinota bacterium]
MTYKCKLKIFEGPLDLLLHLIKEQKMDIYDIPIAEITQQYMQYLELMQEMNLELVGEYLVMAAELTRIKSKTLLPAPETDEDADLTGS